MCNIIILEEFLAAEFEAALEENNSIDINTIIEENKEWGIALDALFPC